MTVDKPLGEIIAELQRFPPDSIVEPVDGGTIVIHRGAEILGEVITFTEKKSE